MQIVCRLKRSSEQHLGQGQPQSKKATAEDNDKHMSATGVCISKHAEPTDDPSYVVNYVIF
jgi:hypothetical protein